MQNVRHYFPGGNTPDGFVSFYDNILRGDSVGKLGIIKGGPGTGKSSLMKKVGAYFEDIGEYVHYLHCSSDSDSLDGVYLPKYNSAIIDGTAPHVVDCRYPGAYDKIFNVGILIDDKIRDNKEEIFKINKSIKCSFTEAYEYLKVARDILDIMKNRSKAYLDESELNNFCYNISKRTVNEKNSGKIRKMFLSAITPKGVISFADTILHDKYVVNIQSEFGDDTSLILDKIISYCKNQNIDMDIFYNPLCPAKAEHILFCNSHFAVTVSNKYHNVKNEDEIIYYNDFVKNDYDNSIEQADCDKYISKAVTSLKKAKMLHDDLEAFYIDSVDFSKMDIFYEEIKSFLTE